MKSAIASGKKRVGDSTDGLSDYRAGAPITKILKIRGHNLNTHVARNDALGRSAV